MIWLLVVGLALVALHIINVRGSPFPPAGDRRDQAPGLALLLSLGPLAVSST
jgi:hypothetical protein